MRTPLVGYSHLQAVLENVPFSMSCIDDSVSSISTANICVVDAMTRYVLPDLCTCTVLAREIQPHEHSSAAFERAEQYVQC